MNYLFTQTPFLFFTQSFWRDEAFSYLLSKRNLWEIIYLTARDFNPPLYYFVLHFWMKLFGGSEIALRSLSLIFFWLTIYFAYLFLSEVIKINPRHSLLYLILFIFNPILTYYAFEARMYTMVTFWTITSFYYLCKKKRTKQIIINILGLYTHYFFVFILLVQAIYYCFTNKRREFKKDLLVFVLPLIALLPWLMYLLFVRAPLDSSFWIQKVNLVSLLLFPIYIFTGYENDFNFLNFKNFDFGILIGLIYLTIVFITILSIFAIKKLGKNSNLFLLIGLWVILPPVVCFVISLFKPIFLARYLIISSPGLLIFIIFILNQLKTTPKILFFLLVLFFSLSYQKYQLKFRSKANLAAKIKEIKAMAKANDLLYVTSELDFPIASYYFDENKVFIYGKSYEEIPAFVGKVLIPREKVVNSLPHFPNKAFILKTDQNYDILASY